MTVFTSCLQDQIVVPGVLKMSPSIDQFVDYLRKSKLLSDAQLALLRKQLVGNPITATGLADVLVEQSHLTEWQARQLLKGETGFVLQQYCLESPIGRGGMGHVFRGKDMRSTRVVAVKVMARKLTGNQALVSRFRREIRANAQLNSPHIVRSLDAGRVGKVDFMVMEFVNGDQVDRMATVLKRVPTGLACDIVRQTAEGLQHAHEHGMVHRDIKPANLMVDWTESGDGIVKLMDMGLVLLKEDQQNEKTVTRAGQVMGTPDFMSPEQGWDTGTVDIRSDIYGLGCTLYRLLTGTVPFAGTNPLQVLSQRLQRDAPSVQTICDDIPDDVAAIVSRMTLRDPNARYQQPAEVAAALATVSEPLTRKAMKKAARKATNNPNANADFGKGSDDAVDETDGTYRQFLKEVQDGSVVDLMLATDASEGPAVETLPLLNIEAPSVRRGERSQTPRRGQKTGFIVMGVAAIALLGIGVFAFSQPESKTTPSPAKVEPLANAPLPTVEFAGTNTRTAVVGKTWQHQVIANVSDSSAKTEFKLGVTAPPLMEISATGLIKWSVPDSQTPADYQVPVMVNHIDGDKVTELGATTIPVTVSIGFSEDLFPERWKEDAFPDEPLEFSVAAKEPLGRDIRHLQVGYAIMGKRPPGLKLDEDTGRIKWRPTAAEVGAHPIMLVAFEQSDPSVKVTRLLRILVRPATIQQVVDDLPVQAAVPGQLLQVPVELRSTVRIKSLGMTIQPGPTAPAGVSFDRENRLVQWKVPADAEGQLTIPLVAFYMQPDGQKVDLKGSLPLVINVAGMAKENTAELPDSAKVEAALNDLNETLNRQIMQARTSADKAELASRLLEQAVDGKPGASDLALLQLIETELAQKARATDVMLRIVQIREERYGISQVEKLKQVLSNVRRTGVSPRQQDLTIEWSLLLAKKYSETGDYEVTGLLLKTVEMLLGRTPKGPAKMLSDEVSQAKEFAEQLTKESVSPPSPVKVAELERILDRWQFKPVLKSAGLNTYMQFGLEGANPVLADNGRSLWDLQSGFVGLKSGTVDTYVGVVDNAMLTSSYVLRFELRPVTNCGHILFGVAGIGGDDVKAFRLTLDAANPGGILSLRPAANVGEMIATSPLLTDQCNLVELVVDSDQVIARINGVMVSRAAIPGIGEGRIGVMADLRVENPVVSIRSPRILVLPESQ